MKDDERPVGIEPTSPVWKTGVSAEFTTTA